MDRLGINLSFIIIYLDEVFIASLDLSTHVHHLHLILKMLHIFGYFMNPVYSHVLMYHFLVILPMWTELFTPQPSSDDPEFPPLTDKPALQ